MSMEKCNVVEEKRTPDREIKRADENWDKEAASQFKMPAKPVLPIPVVEKKNAV